MKEWIREMKKNRERDISRIKLENNVYKTLLEVFYLRALNIDRF